MHKKIAVLLCMMLVVGVFSGCSKEQQGFLEELDKIGQWEAYDFKLTATVDGNLQDLWYYMDIPIEEGKVKFDVEGYINVEDECAQLRVEFLENAKGKIPDIQIFLTPDVICMNRDYLITQSESNRFDRIKEKYISWPTTYELEALQSFKKSEKWYPKISQIVKEIEVNMPLTQNGRTYTLNLNHDQMGEISKDYAKGIYAQLDEMIALYLEMIEEEIDLGEVPQDEIPTSYEDKDYAAYYEVQSKEFKEEMDKYFSDGEYFEMLKYFVQGSVYGSVLHMNTSFKEDSMMSTYKGKSQFLKQYSTNYDVAIEIKRAQKHSINLPKEMRKLTLEQREAYDNVEVSTFYIEKGYCDTTIEDIRKVIEQQGIDNSGYYEEIEGFTTKSDAYVNLQTIAYRLNYVLQYDESKKQYYLVSEDEIVHNYNSQSEKMDQLALLFAAGEITKEEYENQLASFDSYDDEAFVEAEDAKHLYVDTVEIGRDVFVALSEIKKLGFESKKTIESDKESYYGVYIYVYEPFQE